MEGFVRRAEKAVVRVSCQARLGRSLTTCANGMLSGREGVTVGRSAWLLMRSRGWARYGALWRPPVRKI